MRIENAKTIEYEFYGNTYNLSFEIGKYANNGRLYIGLVNFGSCVESFSDFTINIPMYIFETDKEVVVDSMVEDDLLDMLEDLGIIRYTGKYAFSGFGRYRVVEFYEDKASEYVCYKEV